MKAKVSELHTIKTVAFINPAHGFLEETVKEIGWNDHGGEIVKELVRRGCYASGRASQADDATFFCAHCNAIQHIQDGFICDGCHRFLCLTHLKRAVITGQKDVIHPLPDGNALIAKQDTIERHCADCWQMGRAKRVVAMFLAVAVACLAPFKAICNEGKDHDPAP